MSDTPQQMRQRLAILQPLSIDIEDESARHAGHEGAKGGGGHYRMRIVSAAFAGKSNVQRHRMVYDALGEMMRHEIHALSLRALEPAET